MLNLLLIPFQEFISAPARIVGIIVICICAALVFLAKKLTRVIKRESEVDATDKTYIKILTIAFVGLLIGMIICCF